MRCPCGKVHCSTRRNAIHLYRVIQATRNGSGQRVRFYQCGAGGWHWTRRLRK